MQSISLIRSLLILFFAISPVIQTQSMVNMLSKKFTKQNMVQSVKVLKTFAINHKYKTGVAVLLLSGLSGGIWYRNVCRRARVAQAKEKAKAKAAQDTESKRLAEEARIEDELAQQQRQKVKLEEEQGDSQDLRRRSIELDERLEEIDEKIDEMLKETREKGATLPANLERGLDICGFLTDDTDDFGLPAIKKVLDQMVTLENLAARTEFRKLAEPYIISMENILNAIEKIVDADELNDISPELIKAYDACEDNLVATYQRLRDILSVKDPEEA